MQITVVGAGYVGLSMAMLLSQKNPVTLLDISVDKIQALQKKKSPIEDEEIEKFLADDKLTFEAKLNSEEDYRQADFVVIATPTDYCADTNALC